MVTDTRRPLAVGTGATSGIGLETSRGLARASVALMLACRDDAKPAAVRELRPQAEKPPRS